MSWPERIGLASMLFVAVAELITRVAYPWWATACLALGTAGWVVTATVQRLL